MKTRKSDDTILRMYLHVFAYIMYGRIGHVQQTTSSTVISIYKKAGATPVPSIASDSAIYTSHIVTNLLNAKTLDVS